MNEALPPFPRMISKHGQGQIQFTFLSGKLFVAFVKRRDLLVGLSALQSGGFRFKYRNGNSSFSLQGLVVTPNLFNLAHLGRVTQICVFTLQLCKTDDANLRF